MKNRCLGIPRGLILFATLLASACGGEDPSRVEVVAPAAAPDHPLLGDLSQAVVDAGEALEATAPADLVESMAAMASAAEEAAAAPELTVDYPLDESVFPPEFVPPTFLWHDPDPKADTWLVRIRPSAESERPISVLVPGPPPPRGKIDPETLGPTNEVYQGTEYQNSARSWTPSESVWEEIKRRSVEAPATVTFTGFVSSDLGPPRSRGSVRISTSNDPVGAPIFYRDVPLMPSVGEHGRIMPLGTDVIPSIAWRLREVSSPGSKVVLTGMASCGNCHSFSLDGKTLGMDVDGPAGDKGMYAIKPLSKNTVIETEDTITWNSFADKPEGHRTIGFLSRISPDGSHVVTTVNEALHVANFVDYKVLQVFYPTRGILAYYSRAEDEIRALPGADDPQFVHCDPAWTPDGSQIVFARAPAFDPYPEGLVLARYPNDPNEPQIRYDLYRMPFDGGKGGEPVPVAGASRNGMSNVFPKISPDGKWIVFVKCKNGQLLRPDGRLHIVPLEGGEARQMRCNTDNMNSWHSFSPNGRWMVFSSKTNTPYTQAFLTHIDEDGNDTPAILVPGCTADNRAVNLPEFLNASFDSLDSIDVPAVEHHVHYLTASRLIRQGMDEKGIAELKRAVEMEPTFSRAQAALAVTLARLERIEEALPHFERAAEFDPDNPLAYLNLGMALAKTGRQDRACTAFERAVEIAPSFPAARDLLAQAYARGGRPADSAEQYFKLVKLSPENGVAHWQLFYLLKALGRERDALHHLGRAVELKPQEAGLLARLAWELATCPIDELRNGPRAVELAKRSIDLSGGKLAEAYDALGVAFAETGKFDEAIGNAGRALALVNDPSSPLAAGIRERLELYRARKPARQDPAQKPD